MSESNVNNLMGNTMEKIKEIVNVDTVMGSPITTPDGTVIIPVSKVNYGFASGGSDIAAKSKPTSDLFAGGAGAGVTVTPIAFLVVSNGNVKVLQIEPFTSSVDRVVQSVPDIVDKISSFFSKKEDDQPENTNNENS